MPEIKDLIEEHKVMVPRFLSRNFSMPRHTFEVIVQGESISIPRRLYGDVSPPLNCSDAQKLVWSCLYSRMSDGFVRERFLKEVLYINSPYVVPFVIQLCGEYVIEIISIIHSNLSKLNREMYIEFFNENPEFIYLTRQRAISYWNCYFQYLKPLNKSRLAFEILNYFEESKPNKISKRDAVTGAPS
jgi:hypothetical protein